VRREFLPLPLFRALSDRRDTLKSRHSVALQYLHSWAMTRRERVQQNDVHGCKPVFEA